MGRVKGKWVSGGLRSPRRPDQQGNSALKEAASRERRGERGKSYDRKRDRLTKKETPSDLGANKKSSRGGGTRRREYKNGKEGGKKERDEIFPTK